MKILMKIAEAAGLAKKGPKMPRWRKMGRPNISVDSRTEVPHNGTAYVYPQTKKVIHG